MCILREHLPHCMNSDSAPFRHQVQNCINSLVVRARDSSVMYCKSVRKVTTSCTDVKDDLLETLSMWLSFNTLMCKNVELNRVYMHKISCHL